MAVAFGNTGTGSTSGVPATSFTIPITIGSGANRAVFVGVAASAGATTVSLSGAGVGTYVQVNGYNNGPFGNQSISLWYGLAPTAGAQTITVTLSASDNGAGGAVEASGVDQTTVVGTAGTGTGSSTTPTANAASVVTGDGAVCSLGVKQFDTGVDTATANGNNVKDWGINDGGVSIASFGAHNVIATGTVAMGWTLSASLDWGEIAVRVIAAAAGGVSKASPTMVGSMGGWWPG